MRSFFRTAIFLCLGVWSAAAGNFPEDRPSPDASWVCDFSRPRELERFWKFDGSRLFVPKTRFYVADEPSAFNGKVLVVQADQSTGVMLTAPNNVDLNKTPIMRWRWRVVEPIRLKGADRHRENEPDDQSVVVYFGDGTLIRQKCVGYRWEAKTPLHLSGQRVYAAGMMTVNYKCVRNNSTPTGQWVTETRDVLSDFRRAYRKDPNAYFIVSVGANSQYTKSNTRAEIDFIELIPRRENIKSAGKKE